MAALFTVSFGMSTPLAAYGVFLPILAETFGFGAALGPAATGFLHDLTGSYAIPFGAAPIAVLVSWGLFTLGSTRGRR